MAQFEALRIRAVAIELEEKAFALYAGLVPIITETATWVLNALDPSLPLPFRVRVQLDAYEALVKESLKLTDWMTAIKAANPEDTLSYPLPPDMGGVLSFTTLCFETISF